MYTSIKICGSLHQGVLNKLASQLISTLIYDQINVAVVSIRDAA